MLVIPIAAFLVGALLSLLLPISMLIALVVWYVAVLRRAHDEPKDVPPASDASKPAPDSPGSK
jgi:hypothetical protein